MRPNFDNMLSEKRRAQSQRLAFRSFEREAGWDWSAPAPERGTTTATAVVEPYTGEEAPINLFGECRANPVGRNHISSVVGVCAGCGKNLNGDW